MLVSLEGYGEMNFNGNIFLFFILKENGKIFEGFIFINI